MKIHRIIDTNDRTVQAVERDGKLYRIEGDFLGDHSVTDEEVSPQKELYPYIPPSILGIGANYRGLFKDKPLPEFPVVFFKCHNALQNPWDPIVLPRVAIKAETVKFEGELAVIIGKGGKNIPEAQAMDHVFGYSIANDVSASDWQRERVGNQWCKGKGFDTFCPLGPAIVSKDELPAPDELRIITKVNGTVEQDESVSQMCFSVPQLIAFLSAGHTLNPGDLILTGTPPGARFMDAGETVEIEIPGIGKLTNPVEEEQ
jgi:2-keto-4-pentenoate hydratase/2-oxohepta-3-ene-1,7-dioic acid hydratase in catechol pathway